MDNPATTTDSAKPASLVELENVSVAQPGRPGELAIESIQWRITPGDFWVVAGGPGSGKSPLLATVAGLQPPTAGRVRLSGRREDELDEMEVLDKRLRIGLVFENGGRLFNHLTAAANVALPVCYHRDCLDSAIRAEVDALLELVDMTAFSHLFPHQISRAQRQRVALARALALKPELLLLDNPTARLDLAETRWWQDFVSRLNTSRDHLGEKPITIVVAADDLRPWVDAGKEFVLIEKKCWKPLGDRANLKECRDETVRELLGMGFPGGQMERND